MAIEHELSECPSCSRGFGELEDFPIIYLRSVKRQEIPSDVVFLYEECEIFVDPDSSLVNKKAPKEVVEFFKQNPPKKGVPYWHQDSKKFNFNGWGWRAGKSGNETNYNRSQEDQKLIILKYLNPYLDSLETFVGREVPRSHFLPPFNRNNYFQWAFDIPETGYQFGICEDNNHSRKADLAIFGEGLNMGSAGGPTLSQIVTVAKIEYEGRLNK